MLMQMKKEERDVLLERIQSYVQQEHGEEIGLIAAEQWLQFIIKEVGPVIYNHALQDARKMVNERFQSLEDELYTLEKPFPSRDRA